SLHSLVAHPHLPSFPTRRSSDLKFRQSHLFGPQITHHPFRIADRPQRPLKYQPVEATQYSRNLFPVFRPAEISGDAEVDQLSGRDRKSTRLNSSHVSISYAVFCL